MYLIFIPTLVMNKYRSVLIYINIICEFIYRLSDMFVTQVFLTMDMFYSNYIFKIIGLKF